MIRHTLAASFFVLSSVALAQSNASLPRVFISPMVGNLDGFVAAEIIKQHLPVRVVIDEKDAQMVLVGLSMAEDGRMFRGQKDRNEGNVRLLDLRSGTMVWAGEAGDRTLVLNTLRRGGQRKIAERIAERMKKDYFEGSSAAPQTMSRLKSFLLNKDDIGF